MKTSRLGAALLRAHVVDEKFDPADYSVVVKLRGNPPKPWRWEIYCAGKAAAVERSAVFFESIADASKAGKKALAQLLAKAKHSASMVNCQQSATKTREPAHYAETHKCPQ